MIIVLQTAEPQKCYHVTRIFEQRTKTKGPWSGPKKSACPRMFESQTDSKAIIHKEYLILVSTSSFCNFYYILSNSLYFRDSQEMIPVVIVSARGQSIPRIPRLNQNEPPMCCLLGRNVNVLILCISDNWEGDVWTSSLYFRTPWRLILFVRPYCILHDQKV